MSYTNPLHPPVPISKTSPYNSLRDAVLNSTPQPNHFISPTARLLPQLTHPTNYKSKSAPRNLSHPIYPGISFDYDGSGIQGVPVGELVMRGVYALSSMIVDGNACVLAHTCLSKITFRIIWPGYSHIDWVRYIEVNTINGSITRAQLGAQVAMSIMEFIERVQNEQCTIPEWRCGLKGIGMKHLILVKVFNVFGDVWQADIAVDL